MSKWAVCKKGQAVLELAIFGAILIMLLGVLINYGLKYNFQQQTVMETFRKALWVATFTRDHSDSFQLLDDRHVPDPQDHFAVGSVVPTMSQGGITRNYRMHYSADTIEELPHFYIEEPDGTQTFYYTARIRYETDVSEAELGYREEPESLWRPYLPEEFDAELIQKVDDYNYDDDESKYEYVYGPFLVAWYITGRGTCDAPLEEYCHDEDGDDVMEEDECHQYCPEGSRTYDVTIIDDCDGQLPDYSTMKARCIDVSDTGIEHVPWYCEDSVVGGVLTPNIDIIFATENRNGNIVPTIIYGLHPDYTYLHTDVKNSLGKRERSTNVRTTDGLDWQIDIFGRTDEERKITYRPYGNENPGRVRRKNIESAIGQNETWTWRTSF